MGSVAPGCQTRPAARPVLTAVDLVHRFHHGPVILVYGRRYVVKRLACQPRGLITLRLSGAIGMEHQTPDPRHGPPPSQGARVEDDFVRNLTPLKVSPRRLTASLPLAIVAILVVATVAFGATVVRPMILGPMAHAGRRRRRRPTTPRRAPPTASPDCAADSRPDPGADRGAHRRADLDPDVGRHDAHRHAQRPQGRPDLDRL